jgi:hypothetical protein
MKSKRCYGISLLIGFWLFAIETPRAWAVAGVADTTIIAGDMTDLWKWPRELAQWTSLINQTTEYVMKADQMIKLAGDPKQLVGQLAGIVGESGILTDQLDTALGIQTQKEVLDLFSASFQLRDAVTGAVKDISAIDDHYRAFGKDYKLDPHKYVRFTVQEAMQARYQKAAENAEKIEKTEAALQKDLLARLKTAGTAAERETINAAIAASQQRNSMAQAKAEQCSRECNLLAGKLRLAAENKVEVDKAWAQQILKEMRQRAVDAMSAQQDANATDNDADDSALDQALAPTA